MKALSVLVSILALSSVTLAQEKTLDCSALTHQDLEAIAETWTTNAVCKQINYCEGQGQSLLILSKEATEA